MFCLSPVSSPGLEVLSETAYPSPCKYVPVALLTSTGGMPGVGGDVCFSQPPVSPSSLTESGDRLGGGN